MSEIIYRNNLEENVRQMKSAGVGVIVNLLSVHDLRVVGVNLEEYQQVCAKLGIELITYPIQSMKGPAVTGAEFDAQLLGGRKCELSPRSVAG